MGGRGSKSGIAHRSTQPTVTPTITQAATQTVQTVQQAPKIDFDDTRNYRQLGRQDGADLEQIKKKYDINTKLALQQYEREDQQSGGYTMSQDMNHKLENGQPLDANEKYTFNTMQRNMHALGKDATLVRAAHKDFLEAMGLRNYDRMTESQINAQIKGVEYQEKKFVSAAYNASMNPFIGGYASGGREVFINIRTPKETKVLIGNTKQAEVILHHGVKFRVSGAHFDGTYAYPRNGGRMKRIVVDVDVIGE